MHIWVDADACPKVIKEILFRAVKRTGIELTMVANHYIPRPSSPLIKSVQVEQGFDVADNYISKHISPGDLLISADIPLASEVIAKGAHVINPRGEEYTVDNIQQRLTMRNFMEEMRSAGEASGGPPPLNQSDRHSFANALDKWLNAS
ncbi:MAG: YaiI/YqxD family protein [Gammaproteobacteria bacterium]|nr:YaiI/YqxD family protein [Gammaproteobacteria bacterium]